MAAIPSHKGSPICFKTSQLKQQTMPSIDGIDRMKEQQGNPCWLRQLNFVLFIAFIIL